MTDKTPYETISLDRVGYGTVTFPWSRARDQLAADQGTVIGVPYFLSTVGPSGAPHTAGIGAIWDDGDMYFTSGPGSRKSRDLAANHACTIAARLPDLDVVLDGAAVRTTEVATLERLAARYRTHGWPAEVADDAFTAPFSAPSAGPPPWYLYRFSFHTAVGVGVKEPEGATRWRFER
ncbi:Pyridoxamine 5'-phosphate oxidase [Streptomyces sp. DvalAA-14]|uniref:pyridoxamine 5'-phosphate oxidase family protein n=1 Tax=unclassified Streptomyces TaxID=2593676 RepID=UPI00081B20DF|nr:MULTISPECIES: pyridoxamine 5'-phosphate oxidase family protein [unclassified Streptomyces]MYS24336.1 pyridoxamine 5'-phosphate oxidase family protein [Streptomyces sp. SID4948]SCE45104.1 Pyridoxamine 5'-phosphate oxidase [Streptomyces sp. DvalAA-14]